MIEKSKTSKLGITYKDVSSVGLDMQLELRSWRNSSQVNKYFQIPYIPLSIHKKWLLSLKKQNPSNIAYLVELEGEPIGLTYFMKFDRKEKTTEWGGYIYDENHRSKGIGREILKWSLKRALFLGAETVFLQVLATNIRAIELYKDIGFEYMHNVSKGVCGYKISLI